MDMEKELKNLETPGVVQIRTLLPADMIRRIVNHYEEAAAIKSPGGRFANKSDGVLETMLEKPPYNALLQTLLGDNYRIGRILYFNKTRTAN